jgi:hypothetical protein
LAEGAVSVNPATLKEAMTHQAVAEQKKDDGQENYKEEFSSSERGRLLFFRAVRTGWTGHKIQF